MHPIASCVFILSLCYSIYYFLFYKHFIGKNWLGNDPSGYGKVCVRRMAGFFIFLIPYLFTHDSMLPPERLANPIQLTVALFLLTSLLTLLNFFASRSPENLAMYPQIRLKTWKAIDIFVSAVTWILYLIGYEYLFRGYLFFTSLKYFDVISAIGLNVSLYMLVHIPKGYKETFGSIPMGIVLCLLTYYSGSVWPAIILHSVLALSNEWFSIYFQMHKAESK